MKASTFYSEEDESFRLGRAILLIIGLVVVVSVISAIGWGIGVAGSGIFGRGEQIKQVNSAVNRTFSQEHFETLLGDVKTYDQQLTNARTQATANTDKADQSRLDSIVTGLANQCASTRNQYDADARKVSVGAFRSADLPSRIGDYAPQEEVDCR